MLLREPRRGHASRRGFIRERLIPPTTIIGPSPAVISAVIGPIAVTVIVPSIAIAVIWASIAVVATAIVIGFLNGCVALRQRCEASYTADCSCLCLPNERTDQKEHHRSESSEKLAHVSS